MEQNATDLLNLLKVEILSAVSLADSPSAKLELLLSGTARAVAIRREATDRVKPITDSVTAVTGEFAKSAKSTLKELRDAVHAVELAKALCPKHKSARGKSTDTAEKTAAKRAQRRQDSMIKWLGDAYTEYDFFKDNGVIDLEYIGDKHRREARALCESLGRLNAIGYLSFMPHEKDMTEDTLVDLIKSAAKDSTVHVSEVADANIVNAVSMSMETPLQTKERAEMILEREKLNTENLILMGEIARLQAERNANTAAAAAAADQNTTNQAARQKVKRAASIS
jgi:hypothetical protein